MRKFTIAALMMAFMALSMVAQTTTGRLVGTVTDAAGAAVTGATVTLVDKKTNRERTATTDDSGNFLFQFLDIGGYTVKVGATGFKTASTEVTIQVAQEYALPIALEVGNVGETVNVTAGNDIVNSTNAEISSTLTNRQITELPNLSRNPLSLTLTTAGSASNPSQNTTINGARTSTTNISRDGINIQDNFIRSNATDFAPGRPSVDNVEEFTLTAQASVDAGFGGAQIAFVTPRGGNKFHGAGWIYNRNGALAANGFFNNASGSFGANDAQVLSGLRRAGDERNPRPFRNRNQYGFKVSGPIIKEKLFFFAFAERLKDIVYGSRLITVLTPTARQGIFRYTSGTSTFSANIFNPAIYSAPINGGPGAPTGINSVANTLFLANMPVGNSTETGDGLNTTGYRYFQQAFQDRDNLTSRVDYDLNSTNNISAVIDYNYESNLRNDVDTYSETPKVRQPARNVLYSGGWRSSPTATFSNEFRIGQFFSVPDFLRTDTIPNTYFAPTLITNPNVTFQQQGRRVKTFNLQNTSTWQLGNHSVRFGGQFQKVDINAFNDAGVIPTYNLGLSTNAPNTSAALIATVAGGPAPSAAQVGTAQGLIALLGGIVAGGGQSYNVTSQTSGFVPGATARRLLQYKAYSLYGNDSWRVTPKLTINGGVRWDYYTPLLGLSGNYLEPKLNAGQTIQQAILDPAGTYQFIGGNAGRANAFYRPDKNNISFSASFAYAVGEVENSFLRYLMGKDGFVFRGGYRSSYVNDELVRAPENALLGNAGLSTSNTAINPVTANGALNDRLGSPLTPILTPAFVNNRTYTLNNNAGFGFFGTVFAVDPNLQAPLQHDFQFGVQRTFGDFVLEARYVGGFSTSVMRTIDYNQVRLDAAYLADFTTVRNNIVAGCATQAVCAGTTVFATPGFNSLLTNTTIRNQFLTGQAAELIITYLTNGLMTTPNVTPVPAGDLRARFLPNPNTGVANVLENGGSYYYNSGQFELRRRFKDGFYFQANYSFSKELTDAVGTGQTRVEPFLDNARPELDYARADYDQTHVFNFNAIYELPFGKNRKWANSNTLLDYVIGGWQLGAVWRVGSGAPITFTDARGTFNRAGRSGRQTALTNLSPRELKKLVGVYNTPCGIYYVDPYAINLNHNNLYGGNCGAITQGVPALTTGGAASSGFGQPTFSGQIFFNNGPGQTSGLRRAIVNGPWTSAADISMLKNFRVTETTKIQIRAEAFNVTNSTYFVPGQFIDINSTSFGRVTGTTGNRVMQVAARFEF